MKKFADIDCPAVLPDDKVILLACAKSLKLKRFKTGRETLESFRNGSPAFQRFRIETCANPVESDGFNEQTDTRGNGKV